MARSIFLTGGTGFIGSNIAYRLLQRGDKVYFLARSKAEIEPSKRIGDAIQVIDPNFRLGQYRFEVLEGDITNPLCGIDKKEISRLNGEIDEFWHAAASFSFDEVEAKLNERTNVGGTRNALDLATAIGSPPFHHLSTAYITGDSKGRVFETDLDRNQEFRNHYESTKFEAELLVHDYTGRFSIYRLAVVIGDSRNGQTLTFTGYYRILRCFEVIRRAVTKRIRQGRGSHYGKEVRLTPDNVLMLSVLVPCSYESTINLVPIDWAVETILLLASQQEACRKTFHITNPEPPQVKWIIETSCRLLGIEGLRIERPDRYATLMGDLDSVYENVAMRSIQRKIHDGIKDYFPYVCRQEPQFDNSNVKQALSSAYTPPPQITEGLLRTIVTYATGTKFRHNTHVRDHGLIKTMPRRLFRLPMHIHHR